METTKGYIYILTNPSFKEYVKIGYATDVDRRLRELNRSECVPFSFRIFATYEVESKLSDIKIHSIIDKLNPDLRSIETHNGKKRVREFYAMDPEDAYAILEAIAEIHDCTHKLKKYVMNNEESKEEKLALEIENETKTRAGNFTFSEMQIPLGATLEWHDDSSITCEVYDERRVLYNGELTYLTSIAKQITGKTCGINGTKYFLYKGAPLWDIEKRID